MMLFYDTNKHLAKARIMPEICCNLIKVSISFTVLKLTRCTFNMYNKSGYPFKLRGIAFLKIFLDMPAKISNKLLHDKT